MESVKTVVREGMHLKIQECALKRKDAKVMLSEMTLELARTAQQVT